MQVAYIERTCVQNLRQDTVGTACSWVAAAGNECAGIATCFL